MSIIGLSTLILFAFYHKITEIAVTQKGIKARFIQDNKKKVTEKIGDIIPISEVKIVEDIPPFNVSEEISGHLIQIYEEVKKYDKRLR